MFAAVLAAVLSLVPSSSSATFSVTHVFVEHVVGSVRIVRGSIDLPSPGAIPRRVEATLDARTIKTDDPDRDDSLRGPDWFDVQKFPEWTFVSTTIEPAAAGFTVRGTLTIHGVTQPEELHVTSSGEAAHPHYRATAIIDRTMFGIKRNPLDPAIGKMVDVTLDITTQ